MDVHLADVITQIIERQDVGIEEKGVILWNWDISFLFKKVKDVNNPMETVGIVYKCLCLLFLDIVTQCHKERLLPKTVMLLKNHLPKILDVLETTLNVEWENDMKSAAQYLNVLQNQLIRISDGLETFIPMSELAILRDWYKMQPHTPYVLEEHLQSFFTVKRKRQDIYTSITPANSPTHIVDAPGTSESFLDLTMETERDDLNIDMEEDQFTVKKQKDYTGESFCNISLRQDGKLYSWQSTAKPTRKMLVDLRIYEDVDAVKKEKDPKKVWKLASFRGKIALVEPFMKKEKHQHILKTVRDLKNLMVQQAREFPQVKSEMSQFPKN
jgi:hypothetical protein